MLSKSYADLQQIKSQIFNADEPSGIREILVKNSTELSIQLSSPGVWRLGWDVAHRTFTGFLDLHLNAFLKKGVDSIEIPQVLASIRAEEANALSLQDIENHLLKTLQPAI